MSNDSKKTGIIIVDHGSRRAESNEMLEEVARLFADRFAQEFDVVEPAHMELCEPSIATAYDRCVSRGAKHVVVLPFFLAKGKHWTRDIPSLVNQASVKHPGTEYQIVEPLGIDELMLQLLRKRAVETDEPIIPAGGTDPRVAEVEPTRRRVQCNTCPFAVKASGEVYLRPESGVSLEELLAHEKAHGHGAQH